MIKEKMQRGREIDVNMIDEMYEEMRRGEEVVTNLDTCLNIVRYQSIEVLA